jgi:DNA-binding CsgD family transcriptional regulator
MRFFFEVATNKLFISHRMVDGHILNAEVKKTVQLVAYAI